MAKPTSPLEPSVGEYFLFGPDLESRRLFRGVTFENVQQLLSHPRIILRPEASGIPLLREVPRLVIDAAKGPPPRDLEGGFSGYWLVSERLKGVMSRMDSNAFAFSRCEVRHTDGREGSPRWLCDVVRELDALDEQRSCLKIEVDDDFVNGKFYSIGGGASLVFKRNVLDGLHVFMTPLQLIRHL